jgi:hypothetical protein
MMPLGNSRNWFTGSLMFLTLTAFAPGSWAADEAPIHDLTPLAAPDAANSGISDGSQTQQAVPSSTAPAEEDGDCGSLGGMPLCSPPGRFWLRADALMWWTSGTHLPALVTSNSQGNAPIIGQPGTEIVFGNNTYLNDGRAGVRMTLGGWLDRCHRWGVEADWFSIAGRSVDYSNFSNGVPYTGRPFYSVEPSPSGPPAGPSREIVAQADGNLVISGTVSVHDSDTFDSAGFLVRYNLCCCGGCGCGSCDGASDACNLSESCDLNMNYCRTDFLIGYRHYSLQDGLTIHESIDDRTSGFGFHSEIFDNFSTRNDFNGAELGLNTELRRGRWSLNILTKMALGRNNQTTNINGTTSKASINGSTPPIFYPVGIYSGPVGTNSGTFQQDTFVVIPQLGVELGYQVTSRTRAYIGYNLLYWGNVLRAGDQIDQNLDPRNWAGAPDAANALPFPQYPNRSSNFWAQGINLGLEVRF